MQGVRHGMVTQHGPTLMKLKSQAWESQGTTAGMTLKPGGHGHITALLFGSCVALGT